MDNLMVSCIMCTFGRFTQVQRSLSYFLLQDYENKSLIIFNTADIPLRLDETLENKNIKIINQNISIETGLPYTNIGEVRRNALKFLIGDVYICWDDDDLFLPFHISQGIEHLNSCGLLAWKPRKSYFTNDGGNTYRLMENNMEASVLVKKEVFDKTNFRNGTGDEHISWLNFVRDNKQISEFEDMTPFESYAYVWGDGLHKQSGNINSANNFEEHKLASQDFGNHPLKQIDVSNFFKNILKSTNNDTKLLSRLEKYLY